MRPNTAMPNSLPSSRGLTPETAAAELLRRRSARSSLPAFTEYTTPHWTARKIHRAISEQFDRVLRGEDPAHLVRDLTTETVAGRLGTVREEISRGLAYLEREGALKVTPDLIEILDLARLESIAYGRRKV